MAKISTYPIISIPTIDDLLIGTDVNDLNNTKNFTIGDIGNLIGQDYVPYVGATGNVNLGSFNITGGGFIVGGGTASQFLKADGSLDSTLYTPQTRTLTINGTTYNLSANRSWDLNTIDSLTTTGTSGAATYVGKVLNIPVYQAQGSYITQLSGEATGSGPGNATVTLDNTAVISKILTGLNVTGGTIVSTDTILQAFGKVQNQINGLTTGVTYQGVWNAATNTPFLQSSVGTQGYYYVVDVAGTTNLNGITDWQVGDWAIYNGTAWQKVDNTDAVVSVNGYVGAVVLTASDVGAVPTTRTLTINGVGYNLSADRSWTVGDVRTDGSYANPSWITSLAWSKITGTPTTLAGYGITDGALNTTTLTINGTTYDLTANRSWSVGTVTSVGTSGPLTGGTITGSGTIGITQSSSTTDGYLSASDWNAFNSKQGAISVNAPLTFVSGVIGITQSGASTDGYLSSTDWNTFNSKVSGSGTANTLPMWGSASSLINSPLSYAADTFNFQYNSATGGTVNFTNIGLTAYTYSIQMNNFGSPRSTIHSYTDGLIIQSIGGTQVSRMFANGNLILGTGTVDNGYKLEVTGDLYLSSIVNATVDTDRFIVSDGGLIKYRTGAQVLSDIGAQGSLTLTTTGSSGPATLIGDTLNIPNYSSSLTGYVPYTGATQNVNLGEYGLSGGYFLLDTTPTGTPTSQGTIYWDDSRSTAALIMNGTIQNIGQDTYFYVKNSTGSSIPKGTAVRFAGTDGASGHLLIAPFLADGTYPSSYFMGVTSETIANGAFGQVSNFGELSGIDTSAYTAGALLYASTTVAGGFQTTPPVAPNNIVLVAAAVNSKNNGDIVVRPLIGSNINNDEGVKIVSPVTGQLLQLQSNGLWENKTLAQVLGGTSSQFVKGDGSLDSNTYLTTSAAASTYVPYTGATGAVDLGTNAFAASQISINGAAPTSGSFLGFKHATTVNTGTNGYTSMYTFGTNIIGFKSINGANNIDFSFDMSAITPNVPGGRVYTLPNASGTIALVGGSGVGTVTSVAALTLGTSGTDLSSTVANSTTTPVITLNVPTASATNRGALSAADWTTFNNKQDALTNPVTGTGTTNYLPKFTGTSTIGNSVIQEASSNIGIGGTPSYKLDIQSTTDASLLQLISSATANNTALRIGIDGNNAFINASGGSTGILQLRTYGTTKATLDANGNLGLGVTPSAWGVITAMQIKNAFVGGVNDNSYFGTNAYYDGSFYRYINTNFANLYSQQSGQHQFYTAPSGTAGNAISFTQAMTLTSGGNLLVGTTTDTGFKLDVNGTGRFSGRLLVSHATSGNYGAVIYNTSATGEGLTVRGGSTSSHSALIIQPYDGSVSLLNILATGAATFSSSVTANARSFVQGAAGYLFDVQTTDANQPRLQVYVDDTNGVDLISGYNSTAKSLRFVTGNSPRMTITSSGNVGIGTSSPYANLDLGATGANNIILRNTTSAYNLGYIGNAGGRISIGFSDSNSSLVVLPYLSVLSGGNVLIGTTTDAGFRLDVAGNVRTRNTIIDGANNGNVAKLNWTRTDFSWSINNETNLRFYTSSGNTLSPSTQVLEIATSGAATFSSSVTANVVISRRDATTSGTDAQFISENRTGTSGQYAIYGSRLDNGSGAGFVPVAFGAIQTSGAGRTGDFIIAVSNTDNVNLSTHERMRITSTGNVLIGTTTDVGARLYVDGAFRTGTLTAGTQTAAVDWRLGNARGGAATANALVRVQINGVLVDLIGNYV